MSTAVANCTCALGAWSSGWRFPSLPFSFLAGTFTRQLSDRSGLLAGDTSRTEERLHAATVRLLADFVNIECRRLQFLFQVIGVRSGSHFDRGLADLLIGQAAAVA